MHIIISKRIPTNKKLWNKMQDLVSGRSSYITWNDQRIDGPRDGQGFKKHPSAYSNGWAAKKYKELGGKWKEKKKRSRKASTVESIAIRIAGLDEWFDKDSPKGDWVAIDTEGNIVGPCAQSDKREKETKKGADPLKCMPRSKAHDLGKKERAKSAKRKKRKERGSKNTKKPVHAPT
jgi:hypothetical protein